MALLNKPHHPLFVACVRMRMCVHLYMHAKLEGKGLIMHTL